MLRQISLTQFREWIAYASLEPFDEGRQDIRFAALMSLLANINRNSKKRPKAFEIADFLLKFGDSGPPKKERPTWQQMKMIAQMWVAASKPQPKPVPKKIPAKPAPKPVAKGKK